MTTSIRLRITMLEKRSIFIVLHWWGICKHKMLEKWYKISCGFMLWNSPIKCCSIPPFRWKCGSEYRCGIYYWGLSNSSLFAKSAVLFRYNTWVTNKEQEKVLLWYNWIAPTIIERRTNSCARIIPQKHTIVNVCSSTEGNMGEPKRRSGSDAAGRHTINGWRYGTVHGKAWRIGAELQRRIPERSMRRQ